MKQKKCFKCDKMKPLSDYYVHLEMADGHLNKCKKCTKKDATEHRNRNIESCREYDRQRSVLPHRVELRKNQYEETKNTESYKKAHTISNKKYRKNNDLKYRAHIKVAAALKKGYLRKHPCQICGKIKSEAHHENYNFPLEIIWLCSKHHIEKHHIPF